MSAAAAAPRSCRRSLPIGPNDDDDAFRCTEPEPACPSQQPAFCDEDCAIINWFWRNVLAQVGTEAIARSIKGEEPQTLSDPDVQCAWAFFHHKVTAHDANLAGFQSEGQSPELTNDEFQRLCCLPSGRTAASTSALLFNYFFWVSKTVTATCLFFNTKSALQDIRPWRELDVLHRKIVGSPLRVVTRTGRVDRDLGGLLDDDDDAEDHLPYSKHAANAPQPPKINKTETAPMPVATPIGPPPALRSPVPVCQTAVAMSPPPVSPPSTSSFYLSSQADASSPLMACPEELAPSAAASDPACQALQDYSVLEPLPYVHESIYGSLEGAELEDAAADAFMQGLANEIETKSREYVAATAMSPVSVPGSVEPKPLGPVHRRERRKHRFHPHLRPVIEVDT